LISSLRGRTPLDITGWGESVARVGLNDFEMKSPFKFVDSKVMPDWLTKVMPVATV